jgi:hypothetical protein
MIEHADSMTLEIDDSIEEITASGPFSKERFAGYWTFGGVFLPASLSAVPASVYFMGAIDDILCLDEANKYTTPYLVRQPKLGFTLVESLPECIPANITMCMQYSQKGVEYKVWDRVRSLWAPSSAVSDGGSVRFGNSEVFMGSNELQIVARNLATGCETVMDTAIVFSVMSVCTILDDNSAESGLKVYPVPANDIIYFESERIINDLIILDAGGKIILSSKPGSDKFEVNLNGFPAAVYFFRLKTSENLEFTGRFIVR